MHTFPQEAVRANAVKFRSGRGYSADMRLTAEFTSEPFEGEGTVPTHADRAVGALRAAGLEHDFGPLGTSVEGDRDSVLDALRDALDAAFTGGATRVTVQIERTDD